jgi:hypothetical protein
MAASGGGHVDAVRTLVELGAAVNQASVGCVDVDGLCAFRGARGHVAWIERVRASVRVLRCGCTRACMRLATGGGRGKPGAWFMWRGGRVWVDWRWMGIEGASCVYVCLCCCEDLFSVFGAPLPLQLVWVAATRECGELCVMWGWVGEGGGGWVDAVCSRVCMCVLVESSDGRQ